MSTSLYLVSTTTDPSNSSHSLSSKLPPPISLHQIKFRTENFHMAKFKKSQILMLTFLAVLLFVTLLIPSSFRPKYLYFLINILIIALGAEAGLLSSYSKPLEAEKKNYFPATTMKPYQPYSHDHHQANQVVAVAAETTGKKVRVVEKCASEKIATVTNNNKVEKVKKCPSMPSLFFIGGGESDQADEYVSEEVVTEEGLQEEVGGITGQELFTKAETFIGNFYKQLKMQREDSWKKIHEFYQKAF